MTLFDNDWLDLNFKLDYIESREPGLGGCLVLCFFAAAAICLVSTLF
jgi:hypothetical protein